MKFFISIHVLVWVQTWFLHRLGWPLVSRRSSFGWGCCCSSREESLSRVLKPERLCSARTRRAVWKADVQLSLLLNTKASEFWKMDRCLGRLRGSELAFSSGSADSTRIPAADFRLLEVFPSNKDVFMLTPDRIFFLFCSKQFISNCHVFILHTVFKPAVKSTNFFL